MLDVSRHFSNVEEVKRAIDLLALHQLNVFHWHLTDDQGWRIEIKKHPELTQIGAWRGNTIVGRYVGGWDYPTDGKPHGGYYTQEQIKEIIAYAQQRYICRDTLPPCWLLILSWLVYRVNIRFLIVGECFGM